jgi:hypothetical protein
MFRRERKVASSFLCAQSNKGDSCGQRLISAQGSQRGKTTRDVSEGGGLPDLQTR